MILLLSFRRMMSFVIALCLFQSISGISSASASSQTIGQLTVQNIDNLILLNSRNIAAKGEILSESGNELVVEIGQGTPNAGHAGVNNSDYLTRVERNDLCAGYALYRYTLEVNGIEMNPLPQWERRLRRYCSGETKLGDAIEGDIFGKHSAQR